MMAVFMFVGIINPEQCSGEGSDFSESDEERFMDLSLRFDINAAVEHDHSSDGKDGCRDELYVQMIFHFFLLCLLSRHFMPAIGVPDVNQAFGLFAVGRA
jgi:hypothetical protein